jgi:hypothetical protein
MTLQTSGMSLQAGSVPGLECLTGSDEIVVLAGRSCSSQSQ